MPAPSILPGLPVPYGATPDESGTQFALFSRNATAVTLVLFDSTGPDSPFIEIPLDPRTHKTGDIWHVRVEGVREGRLYGYRIDGAYVPAGGHRYNRNKLILDPYARAVTGNFQWKLSDARGYDPASPEGADSFSTVDSAPGAPRCIVISGGANGTAPPLSIPFAESVIYETHLKGFTCHGSSGAACAGTFRGLTEKIPYLKELGVTAVELMPIMEFDEDENINMNPLTGEKLKNYWGYSTISFLAPRGRYAHSGSTGEQVKEFREMVDALHRAGIEVILDVVINHTAEGDEKGPTLCFRGIDNTIYYILESDRRRYKNISGCGNTFNCNHPIVRNFILDCLRYWVMEMKVDGFRFDLASILGRDQEGNMLSNPPLLEWIAEEPILRTTKIIAEAWDAAGAYQVGDFPGRWADWNGRFRDDVRRFWRGDPGMAGRFATRLTGSSDLYDGKGPLHGINFITCHDGFTLNDLVSFSRKHNLENGEDNRDGENHNLSANYGLEGLDATPYIDTLRKRQIKNFIATLFLSQGVPMMLAGDEFRRTQRGNNNPWCQDNGISWLDWTLLEEHGEIFRFTREMIRFRKERPALRRSAFFTGGPEDGAGHPDISWHGVRAFQPDWGDDSRLVACLINGAASDDSEDLYLAFNASLYNHVVEIPPAPNGGNWRAIIDTSKPSPHDIADSGRGVDIDANRYPVRRMSAVVLAASRK
jgi:glycogen operon protein